jgi:GH15 family glucan-1,4-alpha-glucosidase
MPSRIEDYALIGDCETAALVSRQGSIDWLCWPRFDSHPCFAALLGTPEHGRWLIAAQDPNAKIERRYRTNTLILETRLETAEGAVKLIDFMPKREGPSSIVRIVVGERGRVAMKSELLLRFAFGRIVPWVTKLEDGTLRAIAGPDMVVLRTPVGLRGENMTTVSEFVVEAGDTITFVMTYAQSNGPPPEAINPHTALSETEAFWRDWAAKCTTAGVWTELVIRSLITLKALTYGPTGGIAAAPTTSLPERIGGPRNWDYRYCWLRDATLTLLALMHAGYYDEAHAWREWLLRAVAGSPEQVQIMYGLSGERFLNEWNVPWLPGYEGSKPVRVGNAAHSQRQIDVFGEIMDTMHQGRRGGLTGGDWAWSLQLELVKRVANVWRKPDAGLWESRGQRQHFTYSKVMAWVAIDRAIRSAEEFSLEGPLEDWRALRDTIHEDVCARGYNEQKGSFVQAYGSDQLDASLLLLPCVGFLPIDDERIERTVAAIEDELWVDGFVRRYDTRESEDGLPAGEGVFLACSFWLVDVYLLQGRRREAEALFKRLVGLCNDVGLISEEYDPAQGRMLGNFPQAFTHVALVSTAFNLTSASKPVDQRAQQTETAPV